MWAGAWHDERVDDRALIDAVLAGDRDRFAVVVERETPTVYRACLRILGQRYDAEDVAQEAFVTAFRSLRTYRGEGSLRGWLLRIATRLAFRRLAQRRPTDPLDDPLAARLATDPRADPGVAVILHERQAAVRDAVAALPAQYREVVALRFFGDLSLSEIANITGRPLNTVKTHLRRGLERLQPALANGAGR